MVFPWFKQSLTVMHSQSQQTFSSVCIVKCFGQSREQLKTPCQFLYCCLCLFGNFPLPSLSQRFKEVRRKKLQSQEKPAPRQVHRSRSPPLGDVSSFPVSLTIVKDLDLVQNLDQNMYPWGTISTKTRHGILPVPNVQIQFTFLSV